MGQMIGYVHTKDTVIAIEDLLTLLKWKRNLDIVQLVTSYVIRNKDGGGTQGL